MKTTSWSVEGRIAAGLALIGAAPVVAAIECGGDDRVLAILGAVTVLAVLCAVWVARNTLALLIRTRRELLDAETRLTAATRDLENWRRIVMDELAPQVQVIDGFTRIMESSYSADLHREALRILAKTRASATVMRRTVDALDKGKP